MSNKGDKHWSAKEVQTLKENYGKLPVAELCLILGRRLQGVRGKARTIGLQAKFPLRGKLNGNWRGGYTRMNSGYLKNNLTEKLLHREIVEEFQGRSLTNKELVHHIDGNILNNELSNLFVCRDTSHHRKIHWNLERIAMGLVRSGEILFDQITGTYTLKEASDG